MTRQPSRHFRQLKVRKPDGSAEYLDMADLKGLIIILRRLQRRGQLSLRGQVIVTWLDHLGHEPTTAEFMAFMETLGAQFVGVGGEVEQHEN